ncbi:DNA starvation/stationary phase protection protein [Streptomyces sp. NPDC002734]|uniref:Dps family protein n=1 Tax=Streptomyces sp. NPDC002734 TaxID=3154426 RepID=UPI00331810CE
MPVIDNSLPEHDRETAGAALQATLADLLDLSLVAKQAHWNVYGPRFRSVHVQLDEAATVARTHADTVAERAAALGVSPDGRARTVAEASCVPALPPGWTKDSDAVEALVHALSAVTGRLRERIAGMGSVDVVTEDLLIGLTAALEKQSWMFQAENRV